MKQIETTEQDGICKDSLKIEDVQADETANNEELQADIGTSGVSQIKISEERKELRICKLFVTWPKLFFGK
jgi:hypothetical protein